MRRSTGFTLIELMIVVAIVAILAGVALPAYTQYVQRGRITDAVATLSAQRVKMEQYFQDNRTYANACTAGTIAPLPAATTNFTFACTPAPGAAAYTVVATGIGSMLGFKYSVNEANQHATVSVPAGWTNPGTCWVLKKDGSC